MPLHLYCRPFWDCRYGINDCNVFSCFKLFVAVLIGNGSMYLDDTLCDKYRLPVVLNVFVFCNFYGLLSAWTGVVGKAVTTVARAKKPVHNRFNIFFIKSNAPFILGNKIAVQ